MNRIYSLKKYKTFITVALLLVLFGPTNVSALQIVNPGDNDVKEKCDKYYKCAKKEIDTAKSEGKTLSSANIQNRCNSVLVVLGGGDYTSSKYDYCDTNSLLDGKNLLTLLTEANVKDENDSYQDNIKKCEADKKVAIEAACSKCTKCMDKNEEELKDGACNAQCTVPNPTSCGNSQADSQRRINVIGSYCQYTSSGGDSNSSDGTTDDSHFKPVDSSKFVCGGIISDRLLNEIVKIYKTVSMIMVVAVVIFGMLDFFKAVSAGDAETMKKVTKRFTNRLMIVILIAILPIVLELILSLFGNETMKTCLDKIK